MKQLTLIEYQAFARLAPTPDGQILLSRLRKDFDDEVAILLSPAASDPHTTAKMQGRAAILGEIIDQFDKAPEQSRRQR